MFFVYLLQSLKNGEYYIGSTNDIDRRVREHNAGEEVSTKRYLPWEVVYYEGYKEERLARMREKKLKYNGNARRELMKRVGSPSTTFTDFPRPAVEGEGGKPARQRLWRNGSKSGAGFTMIELLVTVGIFSLVSTVILINYPNFSSRIVLENMAHQVGLSIRQAQSYGLNVQGLEQGGGVNQFPTYGVHFSLSGINQTDPTGPKKFLLFADLLPDSSTPTENNKRYDAESDCSVSGGECVELFTLESVNSISMLCGDLRSNGATVDNWQGTGADCSLSALDVGYTRPDPDATISGFSTIDGEWKTFSDGVIVIRSPRGETRKVVVWETGQIAIE